MSCTGTTDCECGCCAGTAVETPQPVRNRAGLGEVRYRAGRYSQFKRSMLARTSSSDYPALAAGLDPATSQPLAPGLDGLKTREDDDFTVAFLDATAMVLDVLSFYQERLANESYLRTARDRDSALQMAGLVGYDLKPGVSAQAYLAFDLKAGAEPVLIPAGTQAQSVPPPGRKPQPFETSADFTARPDWASLAARSGAPWTPGDGDTGVYLAGTDTQLNPGDLLLIVGDERGQGDPAYWPTSNQWRVRPILTVEADTKNNRTLVTWKDPLGFSTEVTEGLLPVKNPRVFAFRQKASLFGYNAIDPNALNVDASSLLSSGELTATSWDDFGPTSYEWTGLGLSSTIDLEAVYPKVGKGGWVLLYHDPWEVNSVENQFFSGLFRVRDVSVVSRTGFGLSARITRLTPDTAFDYASGVSLGSFEPRKTVAFLQSEELEVAPQPLLYPVYGARVDLQSVAADLAPGQVLALTGQRPKLRVALRDMELYPWDGSAPVPLSPGDPLTLTGVPTYASWIEFGGYWYPFVFLPVPAEDLPRALANPYASARDYLNRLYSGVIDFFEAAWGAGFWFQVEMPALDRNGIQGTAVGWGEGQFVPAPPDPKDPVLRELVFLSGQAGAAAREGDHTVLNLSAPLKNPYDRSTLAFNANVARATHGATASEIVGSGSASTPDQSFTLKQSPVTYVGAPTPSGGASTLEVRVNDLLWDPVPSLFGSAPSAHRYRARVNNDGTTTLQFGDGVEGSRLPTGQNNVKASFRVGLGSAGNVAAGTITNLADRPLGVTGVVNPEAAAGGEDPESLEDARGNVARTALTLDRAVSLTDYRDFARTFSGIAKAEALWVPSGSARGILLTVAGVEGAVVDVHGPLYANLLKALRDYGDPFVPLRLRSYRSAPFELEVDLLAGPDADPAVVFPAVGEALRKAFGFSARTFGQALSADEVQAVVQAVAGVQACSLRRLERLDDATGTLLSFRLPAADDEILLLDEANLVLGVMS